MKRYISYHEILFLILLSIGLYILSLSGYLLFHGLVEVFSISIATCIFMIAWNSRNKIENNYLLFLGISLLFSAAIDLLHTLAFKSMGVGLAPKVNSERFRFHIHNTCTGKV